MKLIVCTECSDVVALRMQLRSCACGKSRGLYTDELNALIFGPCLPIGFHNTSFVAALKKQPENGPGKDFVAFVIEKNCPTVRRADKAPSKPRSKPKRKH